MTELKTLKDFRRPKDEEAPYTGEYAMGVNETCDSLKQEAIKDIKKILELKDEVIGEIVGIKEIKYSEEAKYGIINYIKWKFNVAEEDLK